MSEESRLIDRVPGVLRPIVRAAVDRLFPWLVALGSAWLIGEGLMSPVREELRAVRAELAGARLELVKQNQTLGLTE